MKVMVLVEDHRFGEAIASFIARHDWREGTEFQVIHIIEPLLANDYSDGSLTKLADECHKELKKVANHLLDKIAQHIQQDLPQVKVTKQLLEGNINDTILSIALEWPADLLVAGSHGRSGFNSYFLGSVSHKLVKEAPCALLLIKPDANRLLTWEKLEPTTGNGSESDSTVKSIKPPSEFRILLAIDETKPTDELIGLMNQHHWAHPTHIKLLSVLEKSHIGFLPSTPELKEFYDGTVRIRAMGLKKLAQQLRDHYPAPKVEQELLQGDPKNLIVEEAKLWKADLIIVGCRTGEKFKKLLFGSVSLAVLSTSPCTVLLLKKKSPKTSKDKDRLLQQAKTEREDSAHNKIETPVLTEASPQNHLNW